MCGVNMEAAEDTRLAANEIPLNRAKRAGPGIAKDLDEAPSFIDARGERPHDHTFGKRC